MESTAFVASLSARADELDRRPVGQWHRTALTLCGLAAFLVVYVMFLGTAVSGAVAAKWALGDGTRHLVVAAALIGMVAGALGLGTLADRYGRRRLFALDAAVCAVFSVAAALAQDAPFLIACLIGAGIGTGAQLPLTSAYVSEIAPRKVRGRFVCLTYLFGFCAAPVAGFLGARYVASGHWIIDGWRWLLLIGAVAVAQWRRYRHIDESPRWELDRTEPKLFYVPPTTPWRAALAWRNRNRTLLMVVTHLLHAVAFGGFAVIGPMVLMSKGFPVVGSACFLAISVVGLPVGAALAAVLIERYERKTLLIAFALCVGLFGAVLSTAANTGLIRGAGLLLAVAGGAFGCALHTYQAEVFPTSLRVTASGLGFAFFAGGLAAVPFVADPILDAIGPTPVFTGSAGLMALLAVLATIVGPPSTGRSLDQI